MIIEFLVNISKYLLYIVPLGGYLFEYFMFTASSYSQHRIWTRKCNTMNEHQAIEIGIQHKFIKDNCNSFVGWLLFHIGNIGSNGGRQLFYLSFTCAYFGLSRDGLEALNQYGYGCPLSSYDEYKVQCKNDFTASLRYKHIIYLHQLSFL